MEKIGPEARREIQLRKFVTQLEVLLDSNEFYRKKLAAAGVTSAGDISSFEDFQRLPVTTKQELAENQAAHGPYGTNVTFGLEKYTKIHQTSGTTGDPLRWLDTEESWNWWARCWQAVYRGAGVTPLDRIFFAFSFGPFIGFWSAYEGARQFGALAVPGGGMSSLQRLKAILTNDITVLISTPTYALHLGEVAAEEGIDIANSNVRVTIHAGEPGASIPATKKRIEEMWGARCFDHAGATEVGAWGFECREQDGLHVNESEFLTEIIDPKTGNPSDEGELVITNLGRLGMPVIRYRTGDRVRLSEEPCRCGRAYQRLSGGVIGRVDDALIVRGVNVFPSALENLVRRIPQVGEFAIDVYRRDSLDDIEIRVEVNEGSEEDVVAAVVKELRMGLGIRIKVEAAPFGTLPRFDLKARRVTDHRPNSPDE
ncbi:MAG TPA: phenylacetate--CoA ligase family protein [Acidimicrobiia bacterium]|nr:phenylacetate--CoA ligase family protein [Acidimicrobiia bacterium]